MATIPYTIANGDTPDATYLMANFNYLLAGKGILKGTYEVIKAAGTGTDPFLAYDTDNKELVLYTGDATVGDAGFIVIGGAAGGPEADTSTERG